MDIGDWTGLTFDVTQASGLPESPEKNWKNDVSGRWHDTSNWDGSVPNNLGGGGPEQTEEVAVFGDKISKSRVVFIKDPISVRGIQFTNPNRYIIAGAVTMEIGTVSPRANIDVVLGDHEFQAPLNLNDETDVNTLGGTSLTLNNAVDLQGNVLNKLGGGELSIRNDLITSGGTVNVQAGTVSGNGTLTGDLNNNGGAISPGNGANLSAVPEPSALVMLSSGLACLVLAGRRRRRWNFSPPLGGRDV